ncbi:hypothetical protein [Methylotuvimicrobium buryatense]|uniref:Uncharacterized protein n=1 Tax=Methylotuvimicrobium buryatense TaxID=95641 RepID=A0A4P9UPA7_METBY|nr:hypothetical protein [Methylotuvimicrobium buryatense]QCW83229.1 hypothetical protein EQU24_14000 [Methylotuvimicrobium buryatense]
MKLKLISLLMTLSLYAGGSMATEYIYRDLMANTLASPKCMDEKEAIASASKDYNIKRFSKKFCQTQGYGWHVDKVKDIGKAVCEACPDTSKTGVTCHMEDVVVQCKRIKPGSVGMLPGKG